MITKEPSAVMRSVGIAMSEDLIEKLDRISLALAVDGAPPSRSETARHLLRFGAFLIQHRSPHATELLAAYEEDLASQLGVSA